MIHMLAILRDSFREAVDGFVIYVMLILSFLTLVLVASFSFTPAKPEEAYPNIVSNFATAYLDRGLGRNQVGIRIGGTGLLAQTSPLPVDFSTTDIQKMDGASGNGGLYKFRLTAKSKPQPKPKKERLGEPMANVPLESQLDADWFRALVFGWSKSEAAETKMKVILNRRTRQLEGLAPPNAKPEDMDPDQSLEDISLPSLAPADLQSVTDDMMCDFIRNQFLIHASMENVSVKRLPSPTPKEYAFEIEARGSSGMRGWPNTTHIFFGGIKISDSTLGPIIYNIEDTLVNGVGAVITLLVGLILTAFFIPNMIRKGSLDLLVSKPVSRAKLLLAKYLGGLFFIFILSSFTVGGVWLILGVRSGHWGPEFLLSIPMLTFTFAILYSVSTLFGILTRNAIAAMLLTILFMGFLWFVGYAKSQLDLIRSDPFLEEQVGIPKAVYFTADALNNCLPRYKDLDKLISKQLMNSSLTLAEMKKRPVDRLEQPSWGGTIGVSLAFIVSMLALAYWRFATRDG